MSTPQWSDSGQSELLELVAQGSATGTADAEWADYLEALRTEAIAGAGTISPNALRKRTRGLIASQRAGAFMNRAHSRGLVVYSGDYEISDDREGKNGGKPCRVVAALPALFAGSP